MIYVGIEEQLTLDALESDMHCPRCAAVLGQQGFVSAFWQSENITCFCWCGACEWMGEITEVRNVTGYEPV